MRLIILFTTVLTIQSSFAQDSSLYRLVDRLERHLEERANRDVSWKNERKWALKLSPLHMAVGDIGLYYEQRIGKKISIEVGGGVTISGIGGRLADHTPDFIDYDPIIECYPAYYSSYSSEAGYLAALEFRIYPGSGSAMNQFYLAPSVKYKRYNFGVHDNYGTLDNYRGNDQRYNAYFNCGLELWPGRSWMLDIFWGTGIGYRVVDDAQTSFEYVNGEYVPMWVKSPSNNVDFLLNVGVKIGIGGPK